MYSLETIKNMLNAITTASSDPLSIGQLQSEYKSMEGEFIPFKELGFATVQDFLRSMPDTLRLTLIRGQEMVVPVVSQANHHIRDMVQKQKKDSSKKVNFSISAVVERNIINLILPKQKISFSQLPTAYLTRYKIRLPAPKGKVMAWLSTSNRFAVTGSQNVKYIELIGNPHQSPPMNSTIQRPRITSPEVQRNGYATSHTSASTSNSVPVDVRREILSLLISSNGPTTVDAFTAAYEMVYPTSFRRYRNEILQFLNALPEVVVTTERKKRVFLQPTFDKNSFQKQNTSRPNPESRPKPASIRSGSSIIRPQLSSSHCGPQPTVLRPQAVAFTPLATIRPTQVVNTTSYPVTRHPRIMPPMDSPERTSPPSLNLSLARPRMNLPQTLAARPIIKAYGDEPNVNNLAKTTSGITLNVTNNHLAKQPSQPSPNIFGGLSNMLSSRAPTTTRLPTGIRPSLSNICGLSSKDVIGLLQILYGRAMCPIDFLETEFERIQGRPLEPEGGIGLLVDHLTDRGLVRMSTNSNVTLAPADITEFGIERRKWTQMGPLRDSWEYDPRDENIPGKLSIRGEVIASNDQGYTFAPEWVAPENDGDLRKVRVATGQTLILIRDGKRYEVKILNKISEAGHWMVEVPVLGRRIPCKETFLFDGAAQPIIQVRPLGRTPCSKDGIDLKIVGILEDQVLACIDGEDCKSVLISKDNPSFKLTVIHWDQDRLVTVPSALNCGFKKSDFKIVTWEDLTFGEVLQTSPWLTEDEKEFIRLIDIVTYLEQKSTKDSIIRDLLLF